MRWNAVVVLTVRDVMNLGIWGCAAVLWLNVLLMFGSAWLVGRAQSAVGVALPSAVDLVLTLAIWWGIIALFIVWRVRRRRAREGT